MTVKQLIVQLKKMPMDAEIAATAHDNSELEIQGFVNKIELVDFDNLRKEMIKNDCYIGEDMNITGTLVVLHH